MPDYINDLREVQHHLLKEADCSSRYADDTRLSAIGRRRYAGIAIGYHNAYNRVSELLETWEKQHANHPN